MTKPVAKCYTQLFATPNGQQVLEHLEKVFKENTENIDAEMLRYTAGQRSVLAHLYKLIEKGKKE